jgi:hypothetical protein
MDIESLGFVIGLVGAVILKSSMNLMNEQSTHGALQQSMGREPENLAWKTFLRGLTLVLLGLGLETYARLFLS